MRRLLATIISFGSAAALCAAAALYAVQWIEKRSLAAVAQELAADGESWVKVEVDGLRVVLTGTAPDEPARFRALSVAGRAVDGARLIDAMEVEAAAKLAPPPFRVEVLRNGDKVSLIGLVPAEEDRDALRQAVRRAAGTAQVTDLLEVAAAPPPQGWAEVLQFGIEAVSALPRAKVSISADQVAVSALVADDTEKRRIEAALSRDVPSGTALSLEISAPRPVVAPFTVRLSLGPDGARFDACAAATEEGRAAILRAAVAAGLSGKVDCPLALGAPTPRWGEAVAAGIEALVRLGGGSVTFADTDVTLVAPEGTAPAVFDVEVGALQAVLPEVFALHAVLPPPPDAPAATDAEGPARFTATRSPEGAVDMRGRLGDERARSIVEGFAQARFGATETRLAPRLDADVPEGWTLRVLAGLDALARLESGSVTIEPDRLGVAGATGDEAARADIARLLATQLGDGEEYELRVAYDPALDPSSELPAPEVCLRRVRALTAERKISFAPGSTDLDENAAATLDQIASILRECGPMPLEIAGYTDSQGRDEMNMALSEARAETVLNELTARRILTSGMIAHGYGEADPVADNATEQGREANRRIEFRLLTTRAEAVETAGTAGGEEAGPGSE